VGNDGGTPISKLALVLFSVARMMRGPESSTQFLTSRGIFEKVK
jgi:hypothetical protein